MNEQQHSPKRRFDWRRLESGQALVEYWPTIPAAIAVMIVASVIAPILNVALSRTTDGLNRVVCEAPSAGGSTIAELNGGHSVEVASLVYDPDTDRTTVAFKVTSGSQPAISHWVLGIDQETASRIVDWSEPYQPWGTDPTTGKSGIKFDTSYEDGDGGGNPKNDNDDDKPGGGKGKGKQASGLDGQIVLASYRASALQTSGETRTIVLTFSGQIDIEWVEVTTKAGANQVSTGTVTLPSGTVSDSGDC